MFFRALKKILKIIGISEPRKTLRRFLKPYSLYFLRQETLPLSNIYGLDRGLAIDRYYIERFLSDNKSYIKGVCLEVQDNEYTQKYGTQVTKSDILDINQNNKRATIIGDLRNLNQIPENQYDCIILTQVFQFINDLSAATRETRRILKPGGVLLLTLPSASRIDCVAGQEGDFWRFTKASAKYIFEPVFGPGNLRIKSFGNVFSNVCFLEGLAQEEVPRRKLDVVDHNFPLIIGVMARK